ncbi:tyrosine-type recombinase/integrase [Neisseriaceae bacterium B1]
MDNSRRKNEARKDQPKPLHDVPLSDWTLELLRELHTLTSATGYLFPAKSRQSKRGYISENTLSKIIHEIGFKGIATPHGFRSLASSTLNEKGFNPQAIERQLAHIELNAIFTAYKRD